MKKFILLICFLFILSFNLQAQNHPGPVGIGTTQPTDLLHVRNGSIKLEGSNQYLNFLTKHPSKTGLRFLNGDGGLSGTWSYNSQDETINLSNNDQVLGLVYNFNNNFASLGRNEQIGENEKFGIRIKMPKPEFGGMNIETSGNKGGKPYYGYATDGVQRAIHFYDGASNSWKLRISKDIMTATSDGRVGIGTNSPISRLHVHGPNSNLATDTGLMTIGETSNHIAFGISTLGFGQIYSKSNVGRMVLGGKDNDVLSIDGVNRRVGIGTNYPNHTFEIASSQKRAVDVTNTFSGAQTKIVGRFVATSEGTGSKFGIQSIAYANDVQSQTVYGGKIEGIGGQGSGKVYGLYSQAYGTGTGNRYGIYTEAAIANPSPTTKSWALYSDGNSYFSERVFIGDKNGATGYKLSVDGKIICEDLKMEPTSSWPDYVFEENYDLMSLNEVDAFIEKNNHLPGIPSAQEIEDQGGYEQGEMNRILLEKVEELTLYLIAQKKVLDEQKEKIAALEASLSKL